MSNSTESPNASAPAVDAILPAVVFESVPVAVPKEICSPEESRMMRRRREQQHKRALERLAKNGASPEATQTASP